MVRRMGTWGAAALLLMAVPLGIAEERKVSGEIFAADGAPLGKAQIAQAWTFNETAKKMEHVKGMTSDVAGRFSGRVDVSGDKLVLLALSADQKSGVLSVVKAADLGKPLRLKVAPAIAVSGAIDPADVEVAEEGYALKLVEKGSGVSLMSFNSKTPDVALMLPAGNFVLHAATGDVKMAREFATDTAETKFDLGKLALASPKAKDTSGSGPPKITVSDTYNLSSKEFSLTDYKGKWVGIEFWAFW